METVFTKVNRQEFIEKIVLGKSNSLVKFSSSWNGSGHLLKKMVEDIAQGYRGKFNFFLIDPEVEVDLSDIYHIESFPTLLFFNKGTLVDKLSGLMQKSAISKKLDEILMCN